MSANRIRNAAYAVFLSVGLMVLLAIFMPLTAIHASADTPLAQEAKPTRLPVPADQTEVMPPELIPLFADAMSAASPQAVHFTGCTFNTGNDASVAVTTSVVVSDLTLETGDEIAVFTPDGSICAGVQTWAGQNTAIAAWGDNDQTAEIDGLQSGERMRYRIWDSSTQTEHQYCQETYDTGPGLSEGLYAPDSFHVLASLTVCATQEVSFDALADSHVRSNEPTINYGSTTNLRVKDTATADFHSYLKFDVQGVTGAVEKATMRLYVLDASPDGGTAYEVSDTGWGEIDIIWNNAPAMGAAMGSAGQVNIGGWAEFDVTPAVSGNGLVSIGIMSSSPDLVKYSSKEGADAPQLVVEYESGPLSPPVADFSASPLTDTAPANIQFTDLSSGLPSTWEWSFGDGGSSTDQHPSHTYNTPGLYTVSLTVTNSTDTDTATKTDYINVQEAPSIVCAAPSDDAYVRSNYPTTNYGSRTDLRVKDASADIRSYLKFDVQGVAGPVQTATMKLYVDDASNDGGTAYGVSDTSWTESDIKWNNVPAMGQVLGSAGPVTVGQWVEIDVTAAVTGNGLVSIGMQDGSIDPAWYSSKEGANAPELCVEYQSGPLPPPVADFSALPLTGAVPANIQFTDLSSGLPATWEWSFGDGGSSTEQHPSHTYNTPGLYTVSLTVTNSTDTDTATKTDYINVQEAPSIVCAAPSDDAYVRSNYPTTNYGSRTDLRVKDASADIRSYLKFDVQGVAGPVQTATMKLYVDDASNDGGTAYGVSDTSWTESDIKWNNAPAMGQVLGSAGPVNVGQWVEIDVTAAVTGNGLVSIGVRDGSGDTVVYSSKEGANAPELCVEYQSGPLPPPVADFSALPLTDAVPANIQFTDLSSGLPSTWEWSFGDGGSSTEQHPSHTYNTPGLYTVSLTVTNSTDTDTATKTDYINVQEAPSIVCAAPSDDAYVRSNYPTTNYGSRTDLRVKDASADIRSYLKFDVQGVAGPVQTATMKLYVDDASNDGGTAYGVSDTSWTESDIKWNNVPAMGQVLGSAGPVTVGQWVEIDVTAAVTGNGLVSIGMQDGSIDPAWYSSKEGANAPELCVEYQSGPLPPPVADFSALPLTDAVPANIQFTDLSSGLPATWEWSFGDGGSSTEQHPSHTYNTPGLYTVSLTVTNSTGTDTATKTDYIEVMAAPQEISLEPVADSHVRSNYSTSNFGSTADIRIKDASADFYGYLKFDVQGAAGAVQKATLKLYVLDASPDGGTAYEVSDTSWTESDIKWNNAPAMGQALGNAGPVSIGQWVEIDVTAAVTSNGLVSIGIMSGSGDLVKYSSKEGSNAPLLVVEYQ